MFSGIIIVALPITVIGANFEKQYEKQFFQDEIVSSCTTDQGLVNYAKLSEIFTDLDMRGNLRVKLPKDDEELRTLVRRYDLSDDGKLDPDDWGALIMDCVCEAHEFTDVTIEKVVKDVHELKEELIQMNHFIFAYKEETEQQYQELRTLLLGGSVPAAISTASTAEAPRGPQVPDASFKSSSAALAAETSKFAGAKLVGATSNWGAGGGAMMAHDDVVPITSSPPSPSADETPPPILGEGAEFLQGSLSRASPSEGLRA